MDFKLTSNVQCMYAHKESHQSDYSTSSGMWQECLYQISWLSIQNVLRNFPHNYTCQPAGINRGKVNQNAGNYSLGTMNAFIRFHWKIHSKMSAAFTVRPNVVDSIAPLLAWPTEIMTGHTLQYKCASRFDTEHFQKHVSGCRTHVTGATVVNTFDELTGIWIFFSSFRNSTASIINCSGIMRLCRRYWSIFGTIRVLLSDFVITLWSQHTCRIMAPRISSMCPVIGCQLRPNWSWLNTHRPGS